MFADKRSKACLFMRATSTCPKCAARLRAPVAEDGHFHCTECGYEYSISPIAPGAPEIDSLQTGFQTDASRDAIGMQTDDADADISTSIRVVFYSREILALLGIRSISPVAWAAAIGMFFLPWVDIKCIDRNGALFLHTTTSGAQMITMDQTVHHPKDQPERAPRPRANAVAGNRIEIVAQCLLGVYIVALTGGLVLKLFWLTRSPSVFRPMIGVFLSTVLFWLLLAMCWILLRNPFYAPGQIDGNGQLPRPGQEQFIIQYTVWYYASYLANLIAVIGFALEFWYVRRLRRQHLATSSDPPA